MYVLNNYLLVFIGGGFGVCFCYVCNLIGVWVLVGSLWLWLIFLINISGVLLMGVLVEVFVLCNGVLLQLCLLLVIGVFGGYIMFFIYVLEIGVLLQCGQYGLVVLYVGGLVVLGLVGLFGGMKLVWLLLG